MVDQIVESHMECDNADFGSDVPSMDECQVWELSRDFNRMHSYTLYYSSPMLWTLWPELALQCDIAEELHKFLRHNPLGSIFDLEDEPTKFKEIRIDEDCVLEHDVKMPNEAIEELKDSHFGSNDSSVIKQVMESWSYRARLTRAYVAQSQTYVTEGNGQVRYTSSYHFKGYTIF